MEKRVQGTWGSLPGERKPYRGKKAEEMLKSNKPAGKR